MTKDWKTFLFIAAAVGTGMILGTVVGTPVMNALANIINRPAAAPAATA